LSLDSALFLDLDGTLAPLAATPDAVPYDPARAAVLAKLELAMGGAMAVLSGRTLDDVRRILGPAPSAVAAVHGLVRRWPNGAIIQQEASSGLGLARERLQALAHTTPGLVLEDKGVSLAVHYRQAPEAAQIVSDTAERLAEITGLVRQDGVMVCELRSPGPDKGEALSAFMQSPPFAGRQPIMVGDDLTDEHGFAAAVAGGGYGVLVTAHRASAAEYRFETVDAVLAWLGEAATTTVAA
jgi:trehalose 6-phosphate phosphatase